MSKEWHKWHAFNFILAGIADELVALGAKETFKVKLLWIWTRYIKKFQNQKDDQDDFEYVIFKFSIITYTLKP